MVITIFSIDFIASNNVNGNFIYKLNTSDKFILYKKYLHIIIHCSPSTFLKDSQVYPLHLLF